MNEVAKEVEEEVEYGEVGYTREDDGEKSKLIVINVYFGREFTVSLR